MVDVLGLSLEESGATLLLPYVMPFLGANMAGLVADSLVRRGWTLAVVRKTMEAISDLSQAAVWLFFVLVKTPSVVSVIVMLSIGGFTKPFHMAGCESFATGAATVCCTLLDLQAKHPRICTVLTIEMIV